MKKDTLQKLEQLDKKKKKKGIQVGKEVQLSLLADNIIL